MTRTLADALLVLQAIAGADERDGATRPLDLANATPQRLDGVRIGAARNLGGFHASVDAIFEDALEALRSLGAEVVDVEIAHANDLEEPEFTVLLYEFKADLDAYLATIDADVPRSLEAVIAFNREHAAEEMPYFGQELFEQAVAKGPLTDAAYLEALATSGRLARDEGLDVAFAESGATVVVGPTNAPAWLTDHVNGDHYIGGNSSPAAIAGYPSVSVPMGEVSGLPVGISFIAPAWRDADAIAAAWAFERATKHRLEPTLAPSIDGTPTT
jgi:amidase